MKQFLFLGLMFLIVACSGTTESKTENKIVEGTPSSWSEKTFLYRCSTNDDTSDFILQVEYNEDIAKMQMGFGAWIELNREEYDGWVNKRGDTNWFFEGRMPDSASPIRLSFYNISDSQNTNLVIDRFDITKHGWASCVKYEYPNPNDESLVYYVGTLGSNKASKFFSFDDYPIFNIDYSVFESPNSQFKSTSEHPAKNHYSCADETDKYAYVHDKCEGMVTDLRTLYVVNKATGKANTIKCKGRYCTFIVTEKNLWFLQDDKIFIYDLGGSEIQKTIPYNKSDAIHVSEAI